MGKADDEVADYTVKLLRESGAAWFCEIAEADLQEEGVADIWLPKNKCEFPPNCQVGQVVEVTVPNWLAETRGLA
jgi:hypothetical protein